ncbi:response regulator [Vibrio sp. SCSIO 43135]|uniref:ATP-binding protein n=1 Tax=Vibrio sp. SCSIO 43135 TaxID=2819096 RepID=UPI002074D2A7|nr:ATP-binding protein [Vibrio sp. SCSIO 43135]USD39947.1 response regulator [Vibrio sp. SCSIO 43135]
MTFRTKTIVGIALIEVVLLMVLVFSAMSFLKQSNEKQLIQRANSTATMFAHAAKDAVLSTDIATLEDLSRDFMQLEDVHYVKIVRHDEVLACAGDMELLERTMNVDQNLGSVDDGVFDTRVNITSGGIQYGYVDMGFGTSAISAMLDSAKRSIVGIASIEVVLVAIFSFVLGTYLTKSLVRLTRATHILREKGPGFQLNDNSKDEFGELSKSFDLMSLQLKQSYEDLKAARQEAEHACESKGRFLASMSHEIRTPMNGVLGILSLLEETKLSKEQQQLVTTATQSGAFLLSVINDILDFTRMESNTLRLEHQPFELKTCIEDVVDSFGPSAKAKDLILHSYIEGDVPSLVEGDVNRVRQILHNLIGNALKFTQEGSITVKVSAIPASNQQTTITCSVIDTGIGIEQSAMEYLFDEFTMVDQTYSRTQEGSGLGLAICKRLCELMDGNIEVNSEPNQGSTFTFQITLNLAQSLTSNVEPSTHQMASALSGIRVLVAEDNKANQLVIKNMFLHAGIQIDLVENGVQAVEQVQEYSYDIVFMDISMPQMDGMTATQKIRALDDPTISTLPIVALTAHALTGDKEQFLKAGMSDYLSKPVRLSQLIEKIELFLVNEEKEPVEDTHSNKTLEPMDSTPAPVQNTCVEQNSHATETEPHHGEADLNLVDESILQQMIEDTSADVIPLLIDHYVEESKDRLSKIHESVAEQNGDQLEFESHTLGSSALALGNRQLSSLAREIEKLCLEGNVSEAFALEPQLQQLAQQSIDALLVRKDQGFETPSSSNI